jgi:hypothetical protein
MKESNLASILESQNALLQRELNIKPRKSILNIDACSRVRGPRIYRKEIDKSRLKKVVAEAIEICRYHVTHPKALYQNEIG